MPGGFRDASCCPSWSAPRSSATRWVMSECACSTRPSSSAARRTAAAHSVESGRESYARAHIPRGRRSPTSPASCRIRSPRGHSDLASARGVLRRHRRPRRGRRGACGRLRPGVADVGDAAVVAAAVLRLRRRERPRRRPDGLAPRGPAPGGGGAGVRGGGVRGGGAAGPAGPQRGGRRRRRVGLPRQRPRPPPPSRGTAQGPTAGPVASPTRSVSRPGRSSTPPPPASPTRPRWRPASPPPAPAPTTHP